MGGCETWQVHTVFSVLNSLGIRTRSVVLIHMCLCKKDSQSFPVLFLRNGADAILGQKLQVSILLCFFSEQHFFAVSKYLDNLCVCLKVEKKNVMILGIKIMIPSLEITIN